MNIYALIFASGLLALSSCSPKAQSVKTNGGNSEGESSNEIEIVTAQPMPGKEMNSRPVYARLRATLFKMSGNYANNVAVTLDPDGELQYFPAPSDINENSKPEEVGEGWWLNKQGLGANSVFTRYTFDEYRNLKTVPTPEEIKAAIIPGARVTEYRQLAIPAEDARTMPPSALLQLVNN